ncbi:MAG: hypothetical protein ABI051_08715 [Vicinamibacterales bacterium]
MKRPIWLVAGAVIAVLVVWLALRSGGGEHLVADLIEQFPSAKDKRPSADVFSVVDASLGGEHKKAILVKDPSRIVYSVTVPENAQLKVSIGLLEQGWTTPGDGVLFRILVGTANAAPEEILNQPVDPFGNPQDRNWHDLTLDLSEYAGETIDLLFNTNASLPSRPPRDDRAGDLAVWGAPRVVTR